MKSARDLKELRELASDKVLTIRLKLNNLLDEEFERAYKHGMKSAIAEKDMKKAATPEISFTQADQDAVNKLKNNPTLRGSYGNFGRTVQQEFERIIAESFTEPSTVPGVVDSMRNVVNTEAYKLTRIARTEMINVTNEGRLSAYEQRAKIRGKENRYTLIVAGGARTCDAHKELASMIPSRGLPLQELIDLQMQVAGRHGLSLSGRALLHPNQRTVIMRVP